MDQYHTAAQLRILAILDRAKRPVGIPQLRRDERLKQFASSLTELKHNLRYLVQTNQIHTRGDGFVAGEYRP